MPIIDSTSVNILVHVPLGSSIRSKLHKNHWLSHSYYVPITLSSTKSDLQWTLSRNFFRLIWMIPGHTTSSSSCSPNGNPVQRQWAETHTACAENKGTSSILEKSEKFFFSLLQDNINFVFKRPFRNRQKTKFKWASKSYFHGSKQSHFFL